MATRISPSRSKSYVQLAQSILSQRPRSTFLCNEPSIPSSPSLTHSTWPVVGSASWILKIPCKSAVPFRVPEASPDVPQISSNLYPSIASCRSEFPSRVSFTATIPSVPAHLHVERSQPFSSNAAQSSGEQGNVDEVGSRGGDGGANGSGGGSGGGGWFSRLKGVFTGKTGSPEEVKLTLDQFADQLRQARRFGSLAEFGRGLPRGGEDMVRRSLEQQEAIVRAMTREEKEDLEMFTEASRARVAHHCSCSVTAVNDVIQKYKWYDSANHKVQKMKREGRPLPKTFEEVEKLVGSPQPSSRSLAGGLGSPVARNSLCPCGSKKKYKRCCAPQETE